MEFRSPCFGGISALPPDELRGGTPRRSVVLERKVGILPLRSGSQPKRYASEFS